MSERVWGLKPRWDGTQGLMQWAQIIGGTILVGICLLAFVFTMVHDFRHPERRIEVVYIEIADGTKVKCMRDNSWNETFACEWPTR